MKVSFSLNFKTVVLKSLQQRKHRLGIYQKCKFSGHIPDLLNQRCRLISLPGDSSAHLSLRTTGISDGDSWVIPSYFSLFHDVSETVYSNIYSLSQSQLRLFHLSLRFFSLLLPSSSFPSFVKNCVKITSVIFTKGIAFWFLKFGCHSQCDKQHMFRGDIYIYLAFSN